MKPIGKLIETHAVNTTPQHNSTQKKKSRTRQTTSTTNTTNKHHK